MYRLSTSFPCSKLYPYNDYRGISTDLNPSKEIVYSASSNLLDVNQPLKAHLRTFCETIGQQESWQYFVFL